MGSEPLRVALDATPLLGDRTGVGNFTDAVLRRLASRDDVAATAFCVSVRGRGDFRAVVPDGVRVVAPPLPARLLRSRWAESDTPRLDRILGRPDVVHGPNFVVPPSQAARVVTVHDLTCVRFPELCEADTLRYPALIRRAVATGAWIHTVSEAVRQEVIDRFPVAPERVVTVHNGFDPITGDGGRGRSLAGLDRYVLAVGTVEPRKDLPTLVRAVDRVPAGEEINVVHVGRDGWGTADLDDAVAAMSHPDRFRRLGPRHGTDLHDLYAGAHVVAYPSVYEGFGLPVLEAMSAGIPVVTTDLAPIVEVAGDAAALVPVGDPDALAAALVRAWSEEDWRRTMIDAGHRRAAAFSWDACADGLVDLYRQAIAGSGRASGHT